MVQKHKHGSILCWGEEALEDFSDNIVNEMDPKFRKGGGCPVGLKR
jgi:hypothetical protein